jgi:hypothetical protein
MIGEKSRVDIVNDPIHASRFTMRAPFSGATLRLQKSPQRFAAGNKQY